MFQALTSTIPSFDLEISKFEPQVRVSILLLCSIRMQPQKHKQETELDPFALMLYPVPTTSQFIQGTALLGVVKLKDSWGTVPSCTCGIGYTSVRRSIYIYIVLLFLHSKTK